jgi:hypothetical protein
MTPHPFPDPDPNAKPATEPKVRLNTRSHVQKRAVEKDPACWANSPGRLGLLSAVEKLLIVVAKQRGVEIQKVEQVRIANIEGDSRVWLYTTDATDPERLEVKRYKGRLEVNASDTLAAWDMALPKNERRRYDILIDKQHESPVGPAIYFDMSKPLETKHTDKSAKPKQQAAAATQAPAPAQGQAPTQASAQAQPQTQAPAPAPAKETQESQ